MSTASDSVVEYMKMYDLDYTTHMTLRLYSSPNQNVCNKQVNRQVIRELLAPLAAHLGIELNALLVIIPPPHQQHAHILLASSEEIDPLELTLFLKGDGLKGKAHVRKPLKGPLIRDKDTLVLTPYGDNTLQYVCNHLVNEDATAHIFKRN